MYHPWRNSFPVPEQRRLHRIQGSEKGGGQTPFTVETNFTDEDSSALIDVTQLLANDSGPDGFELVVTDVSATSAFGAEIIFDPETGEILYDPTGAADIQTLAEGDVLEDTFAYTITDGSGDVEQATVTVLVGGLDEILA